MIENIPYSWLDILTVVLLSFSVALALAGIFTAYFGNGRSRTYGLAMITAGTLIGVVWTCLCMYSTAFNVKVLYVLAGALINMAAVLVGVSIAIAAFLILILKS